MTKKAPKIAVFAKILPKGETMFSRHSRDGKK